MPLRGEPWTQPQTVEAALVGLSLGCKVGSPRGALELLLGPQVEDVGDPLVGVGKAGVRGGGLPQCHPARQDKEGS